MRVFYADPFVDMHNRMKEALVLLGRLPAAHARPPLVKLQDAEIQRIREALVEAGLLGRRPLAARTRAGLRGMTGIGWLRSKPWRRPACGARASADGCPASPVYWSSARTWEGRAA